MHKPPPSLYTELFGPSRKSELVRAGGPPPPRSPWWLRVLTIALGTAALRIGVHYLPVASDLRQFLPPLEEIDYWLAWIFWSALSLAVVLLALWLPLRLQRFGAGGGEPLDASLRRATMNELKLPERWDERITVRTRIWWAWKPPFWRAIVVRIFLPQGLVGEDPGRRLAARLGELAGGELRRKSWDPRIGRVVLVAGTPAPDETDIPEASTDPVERARQIAEAVCRTDAVRAEATTRDADGNPTTIIVRHPTHLGLAAPGAEAKLNTHVAAMLPPAAGGRGWKLSLHPQCNSWTIQAREALPTKLLHPLLDYTEQFGPNKRIAPFGTGEGGFIVGWDISRTTQKPHALIVGPTGGGKTSVIRTLTIGITRQSMEIWGVDPKMIELMGLDGWPGVTRLAFVIADMAALITCAHDEMMDRYQRIKARKVHPTDLPPLVVILDEYLVLRSMLLYWWKEELGNKGNPPQLAQLQRLLALSRSAGVYLCLGVQRPDASLFDEGSRDNLRTRISLDQLSQQGALMMWNDPSIGVSPSPTPGRAWAINQNSGHPTEVQCWWTPDLDSDPLYADALSAEESARIALLRPAPYSPWSVTKEGLHVPTTDKRDFPEGGVQRDMADAVESVRARELSEGDRIKLDRGGRLEVATLDETPECEVGADTVALALTWDIGGHGEIVELDADEFVLVVS